VNEGNRAVIVAPAEYGNFELEIEFRLGAGGNSGVGIFYSGEGDPAANGIEIQMLDDDAWPTLAPTQRCGSLYHLLAATPGHSRRWPEWNALRVAAIGDEIAVELNSAAVVKTTRSALRQANPQHAGLQRTSGYVCLFPHTGRSEYRNFRIREAKPLDAAAEAEAESPPISEPPPIAEPPTTEPAANYSLEFDGVRAYAQAPTLTFDWSHPLTLECFAWADGARSQTHVVTLGDIAIKRAGGGETWQMDVRNDQGAFRILASSPAPERQWTHLAAVWDGKWLTFFVDGRQQGMLEDNRARPTRWATAMTLGIHLANNFDASTFRGRIDEVRVSKTARYRENFTPPPPQQRFPLDADTVALFHMDEGQGSVLHDSANPGHEGRIFGAAWAPASP
jgi:hypothetical protein